MKTIKIYKGNGEIDELICEEIFADYIEIEITISIKNSNYRQIKI